MAITHVKIPCFKNDGTDSDVYVLLKMGGGGRINFEVRKVSDDTLVKTVEFVREDIHSGMSLFGS